MGNLTTLPNVKSWLNVQGAADDALLSRLIGACSEYIQTYIGRSIAKADYVMTRDGTGGQAMMFENYPATAVSLVQIDGVTVPESTGVDVAGYFFSPTALMLRGYVFSPTKQSVVIHYSAGYDAVPAEIEQACIELVSIRYRKRDRIGLVSKGMGGETTSYLQDDMDNAIKDTLAQYKKVIPL